MKRSASALAVAGNSIDQSIALVTAGNAVTQDPEKVGTALKTLSLRLRGTKTELQEAGEDVAGMAETTSELRDKLMALTKQRVNIQIDAENYKSSYQILKEMSEVWDDMTDMDQAAALELIGGKNQANVLASMLSNFDIAEQALQSSSNAYGSAMEENEKYLDSIEGKSAQLAATFESLSTHVINNELVKFLLDIADAALTAVDGLSQVGNAVPLVLSLISGIMTATNTKGGKRENLPTLLKAC